MCPWREAGLDEKALRDAAAAAPTRREVRCDGSASVFPARVVLCSAQLLA